MIQNIPNILSLSRLALLAPMLLLGPWFGGSRAFFLTILGAALLTDFLDGFFARRLKAQTDLGRRLDSWADYATMAAAVLGFWRLWPAEARREWRWFLAGVAAYFAIVIYGLLRWRKIPGYHTRLSKAMAFILPAGAVPLLAGASAFPFHLAVILQVICGTEELAIAFLLPGYSGQIRGFREALRMRRGAPLP